MIASSTAALGHPRHRFAAPGAQRITLTGMMAVPDDFGRIRLLLLAAAPDGRPNDSLKKLREAVPPTASAGGPSSGYVTPYEITRDADVPCTVWFVVPAHRRAHFLEVAANARGQWVRIEATVRPFVTTKRGQTMRGVSLDVAAIEAMPVKAAQFE